MADETLAPNGELSDAGLVTNDELDHDEDPDVSSATVNATGNNVNTEWGGDFPTPTGDPTVGDNLQKFRVGVLEFDSGQSGVPNARIELWENGTLVRAGSNTPVSVYAVLELAWNANELATSDGSLVQCKLIGTKSGGSPGARNSVRIGHMEWNVDYTVGGAAPIPQLAMAPMIAPSACNMTLVASSIPTPVPLVINVINIFLISILTPVPIAVSVLDVCLTMNDSPVPDAVSVSKNVIGPPATRPPIARDTSFRPGA